MGKGQRLRRRDPHALRLPWTRRAAQRPCRQRRRSLLPARCARALRGLCDLCKVLRLVCKHAGRKRWQRQLRRLLRGLGLAWCLRASMSRSGNTHIALKAEACTSVGRAHRGDLQGWRRDGDRAALREGHAPGRSSQRAQCLRCIKVTSRNAQTGHVLYSKRPGAPLRPLPRLRPRRCHTKPRSCAVSVRASLRAASQCVNTPAHPDAPFSAACAFWEGSE